MSTKSIASSAGDWSGPPLCESGRDPTGSIVGFYESTPESVAATREIYERVFMTARPIFATGEFKVKSGAIANMSLLTLPLSDDGTNVNKAVSTLVSCFNFVLASTDWLRGPPFKVREVIDVASPEELEKLCLDWERLCTTPNGLAESHC